MANHIGRRKFLATLGGAAAWPLAAHAQQPGKIPRIGIIDDAPRWNAFRHGLRDLGYLEGQNIAFEYAYGDGVPERLAEAAAALVRHARKLRGQASHHNDSDRDDLDRRSRARRARTKPRPTGRKYHRQQRPWSGRRCQAVADSQGGYSNRLARSLSLESGQITPIWLSWRS